MAHAPHPTGTVDPPIGIGRRVAGSARDYLDHIKLFSRNARLYLLGSFLIGVNFSVFNLLFNLYLRELGFVESRIGSVNSARALGMTLIAIPAAMILSRVRLKPMLIAASFLFALFSFGLTSYRDLTVLWGCAALAGMSFAVFRVASGPFFMRNSTKVERTYLFSFSFAMHLLAGMIGSWGAGELVAYIGEQTGDIITGYQYTLFLAIGIALMAVIPFGMVKAALPSAEENRIALNIDQLRRRGRFYFKITIVNFLIGTGAGLIIPFLNLYYRDRFHLPPDTIGFYYILLMFGMVVGTLTGPVLTRRYGLVRTVVFTQLASIPFMLILSYSYTLALVVPAFVIRGGLMNLGVPINTNLGMELSEKREQGLVNALLSVSWTASWMVSVAIGGHVIEHYSYTVALNTSILLYIASAILYYIFFSKAESRDTDGNGWHIDTERQP